MSVDSTVAQMIADDFRRGNVYRLHDWSVSFPNHLEMIQDSLGLMVLQSSVNASQWRMQRYLFECNHIPSNDYQMLSVRESDDEFCRLLADAVISRSKVKQFQVLTHLQEMVDVS